MVACYLELYEEGEVKHINSKLAMNSGKLLKGRNMGSIVGLYRPFLEIAVNIAIQIRKLAKHRTLLICSTSPSPYNSK